MTARKRTAQKREEPAITALARRLTEAAVEVTGDDPLRGTSIDSVAKHLSLTDSYEIDAGIAEAARLGWLRPSSHKNPHSVSVTATWRRERAPQSKAVLTFGTARRSKRGI